MSFLVLHVYMQWRENMCLSVHEQYVLAFISVLQSRVCSLQIFIQHVLCLVCLRFSPTMRCIHFFLFFSLQLCTYSDILESHLMVSCCYRYPQKFDISAKDPIFWCSKSCKSPKACGSAVQGWGMAPTPVCVTLCIPSSETILHIMNAQLWLLHCNPWALTGSWWRGGVPRGQAKPPPHLLQMCPLHFLQNYLNNCQLVGLSL